MDAITVLGTVGAVANIIDIISKSIKTLRDLHERWRDADLIAINLVTQLVALKAALAKISEWITSDLSDQPHHYQLVMDLGESIACCKMLVKSMDDQLAKLQCGVDNRLDVESRLRIVFENRVCEDFQKYVQRQTNALTLLLAACNCKTTFEQKLLLENPLSRDVIDKVKDDSSSMVVLGDMDSDITKQTRSTDNSSKLSRVFQFDTELIGSAVYQRAVRSMVRTTKNIPKKECKILLLGARGSGKETLMRQMKMSQHNHNRVTEMLCYKHIILSAVVDLMQKVPLLLKDASLVSVARTCEGYEDIIRQQSLPIDKMTPELAVALEYLWETLMPLLPRIKRLQNQEWLDERAFYYLEQAPRISDFQYIPTEPDILRLPVGYEYTWNKAIQETRLSYGKLSMHVIGCGGDSTSQRGDWIPHFRDVTGVAFVVDLCSYSQALPPSLHNVKLMKCLYMFNVMGTNRSIYTRLMESLYLFEAVANSRLYRESSIFLFFTGLEALQKKLIESPLSDHFPDYDGGDSTDRAVDYILGLFKQINKGQLCIHAEVLHAEDKDLFLLDSVFENLSEGLAPTKRNEKRAGLEGGINISTRATSSHLRPTAGICSMALSDSTAYMTHATSLRVRG